MLYHKYKEVNNNNKPHHNLNNNLKMFNRNPRLINHLVNSKLNRFLNNNKYLLNSLKLNKYSEINKNIKSEANQYNNRI